ncbi:MAG: DUF3788 domain-containing protein [Prolixibacteraceae bacterium]|nr:DUF3788 domain-containing protein [Prolixibacteraceae bacterium]
MMETSFFTDLTKIPGNDDLKIAIGDLFPLWMEIRDFIFAKYPTAIEEWHISVKKYGWIYRIKDKKRAIIYLSPRTGYFIVSMVFGQKATDKILDAEISENIKTELMNSKVYMEGRVLRLDIHDNLHITDIKKLIEIKIAY